MGINTTNNIDLLQQKEQALYQHIRELIEKELPFGGPKKEIIERNGLTMNIGKIYGVFGGYYITYRNAQGRKIIINVDVDKEKKSFILTHKKNEPRILIDEPLIDSIAADLQSPSENSVKNDIIDALS